MVPGKKREGETRREEKSAEYATEPVSILSNWDSILLTTVLYSTVVPPKGGRPGHLSTDPLLIVVEGCPQ